MRDRNTIIQQYIDRKKPRPRKCKGTRNQPRGATLFQKTELCTSNVPLHPCGENRNKDNGGRKDSFSFPFFLPQAEGSARAPGCLHRSPSQGALNFAPLSVAGKISYSVRSAPGITRDLLPALQRLIGRSHILHAGVVAFF